MLSRKEKVVAWLLAAGVTSCTVAPPEPAPEPAPVREAPREEVAVAPSAAERTMQSSALTLAAYQRELAERIHATNADRVYEGRPPNPLRAIIVYRTEIDAGGQPVRVQLYRSPGAPELEARAAESLRRAAPFPRPRPELLRGAGRVTVLETWLFDYDGRFRLRTLALPQSAD
jgi:protein TonB